MFEVIDLRWDNFMHIYFIFVLLVLLVYFYWR